MSTVRAARAAIRTSDRLHRGAVAMAMGGVLLLAAACGDGKGDGGGDAAPAATAASGAASGTASGVPSGTTSDGAATSAFTTALPGRKVSTNDNIADGQTYGVGMIVKVDFSGKVVNKDAVAKAITFETDNGTEVKGHWFGDDRIDFRPADYWKPNTKVTIHYRLKNVEVAPGVWGDVDKDEPFTIGRSQISTADAATHQLTIARDGKSTTVPATLGDDEHPSWGGTMVIMSKEPVTHMDSQTVGLGKEYDIPDAPHAMRLTRSGTYVHGNYWYKRDLFGKENTSHGCVSLKDVEGGSDTSVAGSFYNSSLIGDVIKVVNTKEKTAAPDNGLGGWNLTTW